MHQVETVSAAPASLGSSDQDNATQQAPSLNIVVEFSGGLEMLFADRRRLQLTVPKSDDMGKPLTIAALIDHLCQHEMNDGRKDLFVLDGHLRPGILVLINDADWELEGEEAYEVQSGDNVLFVSTLHGG
ncbi:Ubiquitin- modifier 1 [Pyricularia oryzae]|uniref:Ubiquitin-related modifier 1 n=1 Tax=Pyricularia grisea TaxID=148305 RepID=A0ABQ8NSF3_PYRGI|nr:Ubiquitin- modifier 1 [Pyricularia oryzae]KAI6301212.1 Ubiquitin- modifier 1 [Pyricularia grisea]KAI6257446.1 Ubiquitin- modifier 1 [Pyricularia oryzae]KAI6272987.1 Ubiquitin- modifier 1 [Pyricularia oryzae]KAI6279777.1 Ubiquitin- modifier 1 [Pyricularia oryzae]